MGDTSDTNFRREIGRRIAIRRRELGITQKTLAEGTGLSRDFVAQVEIGRLEINAGDMPRMCVALGVPVSYFFSDLVKSPSDDPVLEGIRKLAAVGQGELTTQEAILLHNYRTLDERTRDVVSDVADEMASSKRLMEAMHQRLLLTVSSAATPSAGAATPSAGAATPSAGAATPLGGEKAMDEK